MVAHRPATRAAVPLGRPECEAYTTRLIMDSRDGSRHALPWEAAMELMFLAELSVGRHALVASAATGVPFSHEDLLGARSTPRTRAPSRFRGCARQPSALPQRVD